MAKEDIVVDGLLGSFDCLLFGKGWMSIVPERPTIDMHSWFPLFFSFLEQEFIRSGESIIVRMERKSTEDKIWYQWQY